MKHSDLTEDLAVYYVPYDQEWDVFGEDPDQARWVVVSPERVRSIRYGFSYVPDPRGRCVVLRAADGREQHVPLSRIRGPYDQVRASRLTRIERAKRAKRESEEARRVGAERAEACLGLLAARGVVPTFVDPPGARLTLTADALLKLLDAGVSPEPEPEGGEAETPQGSAIRRSWMSGIEAAPVARDRSRVIVPVASLIDLLDEIDRLRGCR